MDTLQKGVKRGEGAERAGNRLGTDKNGLDWVGLDWIGLDIGLFSGW